MRGVCALNFEAMSLLNDPQGGELFLGSQAEGEDYPPEVSHSPLKSCLFSVFVGHGYAQHMRI